MYKFSFLMAVMLSFSSSVFSDASIPSDMEHTGDISIQKGEEVVVKETINEKGVVIKKEITTRKVNNKTDNYSNWREEKRKREEEKRLKQQKLEAEYEAGENHPNIKYCLALIRALKDGATGGSTLDNFRRYCNKVPDDIKNRKNIPLNL